MYFPTTGIRLMRAPAVNDTRATAAEIKGTEIHGENDSGEKPIRLNASRIRTWMRYAPNEASDRIFQKPGIRDLKSFSRRNMAAAGKTTFGMRYG